MSPSSPKNRSVDSIPALSRLRPSGVVKFGGDVSSLTSGATQSWPVAGSFTSIVVEVTMMPGRGVCQLFSVKSTSRSNLSMASPATLHVSPSTFRSLTHPSQSFLTASISVPMRRAWFVQRQYSSVMPLINTACDASHVWGRLPKRCIAVYIAIVDLAESKHRDILSLVGRGTAGDGRWRSMIHPWYFSSSVCIVRSCTTARPRRWRPCGVSPLEVLYTCSSKSSQALRTSACHRGMSVGQGNRRGDCDTRCSMSLISAVIWSNRKEKHATLYGVSWLTRAGLILGL